jgi:predicted phage baseplate assembly protein
VSSTATCGCCSGVTQHTPLEVENRPGLSAIAYRVGVHDDFLDSMITGLTNAERPRLGALGTRDRDDFSIALLDAWAVAADVLAFYNERLQNEAYLRTARERISLQELGRLIGYQLRPGVAAETYLAFAIEPPPEVPATASKDPGALPPVTPAVVTLEPGLRVQSIPGPGEQPQTFETMEQVEAQPEWNAIPASQTTPDPGLGLTYAYLEGTDLNLKPGDALLLTTTGEPPANVGFRILTAVTLELDKKRTRVTWEKPLTAPIPPAQPYVLRKRISVFGHNAPYWLGMSTVFRKEYHGGGYEQFTEWPFWGISPAPGATVDLDGSHPDVVEKSLLVLARPDFSELYRAETVAELSRAEFAVSGTVTRLSMSIGINSGMFGSPRETVVFAVSEKLTLAEAPDETHVTGSTIDVDVDVLAMKQGRRLLVRGTTTGGADKAEPAVVADAQAISGGWRLTLESNLSTSYERESVIVHGNVARATHGETVEQILGSGRAADPFQRFTLAHDPLTYVQSTTETSGAASELDVRVNDVLWEEVLTLYDSGPHDRAYALRTDENGKAYVQFGDGERGARLPTGPNNVRARYRKGIGAGGNVKPGALAQLLDRPLGVKGVSNPIAAGGGVDPETEEAARRSIPLGVRTLGRAVSLLDYEDYALAFTGVVKANGVSLPLRGGETIVVTVVFEGGERLADLADSLREHGDPRVRVLALEGTTETFQLGLRVAVDPAYEQDAVLSGVEVALRDAYSLEARALTEPVFKSETESAAHTVPGVLAVDVDYLFTGTSPDIADRLLAQRADVDANGNAIAAGVLVLDPDPLYELEVMTP